MWDVKCPYCSGTQGRCATTASGRSVTECCSCERVVEERQTQVHDLFLLRAQDSPLCLVTSDLSSIPSPSIVGVGPRNINNNQEEEEEDPFEPTGFITAFSTWSLEQTPVFARSSLAFSGHLAELERSLDSPSGSSGPVVVVDNLRAYLQIIDVSSILGLDYDISDHAFQLFRDCSSATCLRNRSVEALATAALVQAIREAQEPRTLQEISIAANVPQKEIGKYIKILGEALQLSQPINSNSIAVHMPRFCTLLQLNKSAQELATHIGEVVINKCFCTRRNPISISAAAIYLACQLEDKRKTQAEICKVTGLTEVTLRKVYKELLENWDDLLPSNYTPAVPPEKAFPTTAITSGRSSSLSTRVVDPVVNQIAAASLDKDKQPEVTKLKDPSELLEMDHLTKVKAEADGQGNTTASDSPPLAPHGVTGNTDHPPLSKSPATLWQQQVPFGSPGFKQAEGEKNQITRRATDVHETQQPSPSKFKQEVDRNPKTTNSGTPSTWSFQVAPPASSGSPGTWSLREAPPASSGPLGTWSLQVPPPASSDPPGTWSFQTPLSSRVSYVWGVQPPSQMVSGNQKRNDSDRCGDAEKQ